MDIITAAVCVHRFGWPKSKANGSGSEMILESLFDETARMMDKVQWILDDDRNVLPQTTAAQFLAEMEEWAKIEDVSETTMAFLRDVAGQPSEDLSLEDFLAAAIQKNAIERWLADKEAAFENQLAIDWIQEYVEYNTWRKKAQSKIAEYANR